MQNKAVKTTVIALMSTLGLISTNCNAQVNPNAPATTQNQTQMQPAKDDGQNAGDEFLNANKAKPGVKTTDSGLEYKVIKEGTGAENPAANDVVKVNYTGKFVDGSVFDSSKGTPVSFPVNGVIPGFSEALMLMKKNSVMEVYIPAKLAYGDKGVPGAIGPNQALIFTVELLDINKK